MNRNRIRGGALSAVFFFILIAAAGAYLYFEYAQASLRPGDAYAFIETEVKFQFGFEDRASVYTNGNKFFYLSTKDGIKYVSSTGSIKWDKAYSMLEPVLKGRGEYAAVCDNKGYVFFMFGPSGALYEKKYDFPILFFTVGARGDAGIIIQEQDDYRLIVFDAAGGVIFEYVSAEPNVMPVCMDISEDGRLVAVSYLDISGINIGSKIGFMYTNEEGKNYSKTFIGGIECADRFVAYVCFMENNKLIYISDGEIACVGVESRDGSEKQWEIELSNKLGAFALIGDKHFAVSYAENSFGGGAERGGRVEIYDTDGGLTGTYDLGNNVNHLGAAGEHLIASDGSVFKALTVKGALVWEYAALSEVKKLLPLEANANSVIMQTNTGAVVMKRTKAAQ